MFVCGGTLSVSFAEGRKLRRTKGAIESYFKSLSHDYNRLLCFIWPCENNVHRDPQSVVYKLRRPERQCETDIAQALGYRVCSERISHYHGWAACSYMFVNGFLGFRAEQPLSQFENIG